MNEYSLGDFVYLPDCPEWGIGQVQSVIAGRVTVNFEHAGKQLINALEVRLLPAPEDGLIPAGSQPPDAAK